MISLKHWVEDKHAIGIYFYLLTSHMRLQNAKELYFYATVLGEKNGHVYWLSHEHQHTLHRSLALTARTPRARKSEAFRPRGISRAGAGCEQGTRRFQRALGIQQACGSAAAHVRASAVLSRGTKPLRQHLSSESDISSREPRPLVRPCSRFSLQRRSGWWQRAAYHQYR